MRRKKTVLPVPTLNLGSRDAETAVKIGANILGFQHRRGYGTRTRARVAEWVLKEFQTKGHAEIPAFVLEAYSGQTVNGEDFTYFAPSLDATEIEIHEKEN